MGPVPVSLASARQPYAACPLCEGPRADEVLVADCRAHPLYKPALPPTMRWLRCQRCQHVFVDGYFDEAAQAVLFSDTHPGQLPGPATLEGRGAAAKIVEDVSASRDRWTGRWLDVGFGNGALLTTAAEFGYDVVGFDLRAESVRRMQALGYDARCLDLLDCDAPQSFDVVSMADVLEHMPYPKRALAHARTLLRPGGALFVSMPNLDCYAWTELDREQRNPYWTELEHLHNFGRARLQALLRELGFVPARYGISQRYLACMEVIARPS